jgi:hypothetical protein
VAADVAEGLVSKTAARDRYGVLSTAEATAARRQALRQARLGGEREPAPACDDPPGSRFGQAINVANGRLVCRRCGLDLGEATANLYDHLVVREEPAADRAPLGLRYAGSEQFVIRSCFCPHCAQQLDVQISRASEPLLQATELFG